MRMAKLLPQGAQLDGYDGSCKSYTVHGGDGTCKISVLIDKETFYIFPVEEMPACFEGKFKINKRDSFFLIHAVALLDCRYHYRLSEWQEFPAGYYQQTNNIHIHSAFLFKRKCCRGNFNLPRNGWLDMHILQPLPDSHDGRHMGLSGFA